MKKFFAASLVPLAGAIAMGACSDDPAADPPTETPEAGADATDAPVGDTNPPSEDALPKGGSRLSPRYVTTSDGFKVWVGIVDTKLDTECIPTKKYDDALRCAPMVNNGAGSVSYSDANCTKPVVDLVAQSGCTAPQYVDVQVTPAAACTDSRFALYKIVTAKVDLPKVYTKPAGGACSESGGAGSFTEVAPVPATDLVKLTEAIDPISGQIATEVHAGEDGSRFAASHLIDIARDNAKCRATMANDDKPRCVPASGPISIGFSESGCTKDAIGFIQCSDTNDPNKKYVASIATKNCISKAVISEIGKVRANKDYFTGTPAKCTGPSQYATDVYDLGAEVSPALFPELSPAERGGTRIVAKAYRSADKVVRVDDGTYTDKQPNGGNGNCYFDLAADNKLRCLPESGNVLYSDSQCQTAVVAGYASDCTPPKTARLLSLTCPLTNKIYGVGAPIAATKAYFKTTNSCIETDVATLYTLGPEIPPTMFAEGTYVPK